MIVARTCTIPPASAAMVGPVMTGAVVSRLYGVVEHRAGPTFPAASRARTHTYCVPTAGATSVCVSAPGDGRSEKDVGAVVFDVLNAYW